jgi:hypothetical protein
MPVNKPKQLVYNWLILKKFTILILGISVLAAGVYAQSRIKSSKQQTSIQYDYYIQANLLAEHKTTTCNNLTKRKSVALRRA